MRAVVAHGPGQLMVESIQRPEVAGDGVIVRVVFGGICGSDLHYHQLGRNGVYKLKEPLVLGHEIVGIVSEIGGDVVAELEVGDPVAIHPATPTPAGGSHGRGLHLAVGGSYLGSASTDPHTQGGFAEYLRVRPEQLRVLPVGLPLERAALAEPLAVALHAVDRYSGDFRGKRVLVSGSGPIGCLVIAALQRRGATEIVASDLRRAPLEIARELGANELVQIGTDDALPPESVDVVIEASGSAVAAATALEVIKRGGTIVQLGVLPAGDLPIPLTSLINKEVTLQGSQRFDIELDEAVRFLAEAPALAKVITHVFAIEEAEEAFATAADSSRSAKVLLRFASTPEDE